MSLAFEHPWLLALLPLALLALTGAPSTAATYSWLEPLPRDLVSLAADWLLRLASVTAIAAVVTGLSGPYRPEVQVERVARGAEVVLLLDRSRSMDQPFGNDPNLPAFSAAAPEPKGRVAKQILAEFAAKRSQDLFAMVLFSTFPVPVLSFTQHQEMIQAAIAAGQIGRGLADTDIGRALLSAASLFAERPYSGSRVILLVSDGGAQLDPETRAQIVRAMKRHRIALYWIYIRSYRSPGLAGDPAQSDDEAVPERSLHAFFKTMGMPYRAYEAENPDALQRAVADVSRLEQLPLTYTELLPRLDLSGHCYRLALAAALVLACASVFELRRWR